MKKCCQESVDRAVAAIVDVVGPGGVTSLPGRPVERAPLGYVLVDPNTLAMDWDGEVHGERADAIKELAEEVHGDRVRSLDEPRPCCTMDLSYTICAVVPDPAADEEALAAVQRIYDRSADEFANGGG